MDLEEDLLLKSKSKFIICKRIKGGKSYRRKDEMDNNVYPWGNSNDNSIINSHRNSRGNFFALN